MTTAALPSVEWIHLTVGDTDLTVMPSPGIQLRLIVEPVPDDRAYGILDMPRPSGLQVCVDLIPGDGPFGLSAEAVARCESMAARIAAQLGANASLLTPLREFSSKPPSSAKGCRTTGCRFRGSR